MVYNFKKCLNFLRFENKDMESSYAKSQLELLKKVFFFFSIASICIHIAALTVSITTGYSQVKVIVISVMLGLSIFALLLRNRLLTLQALIFLSIFVFWGNYTVAHLSYFIGEQNIDFAFVLGEMFGTLEIIFTLSVKSLRFRLLIQVTSCVGKAIGFGDKMIMQPRVLVSSILLDVITIIFCVLYDFLDRKDFKEIYESREKLRKFQYLLSHDFPSSVIIMTTDFNSILYSNHLFQKNFGALHNLESQVITSTLFKGLVLEKNKCDIKLESEKGLSLTDFLVNVSKKVVQIPENGVVTLSTVYTNPEGIDQYYEIKLRTIIWDEKPSYAIIFNDISDKHIVASLKLVDEQKDRVIATVSHELRTPINGIMGLLEMAKMSVTDQLALTYLEHCQSCSRLLLYLVNSILDLSQLRHNSLKIINEYFNIKTLLEEVKSLYLFQSQQKKIEFIIDLDQKVPERLFSDKNRLIEILINLLGNAMKFTFEGHVRLIVAIDEGNQNKILFHVEDTGIGIKEEDKPKLFKMFGKITNSNRNINKQGVGLGLTIANELVKVLNQGDESEKILFESEYGKGSSFWFRVDTFNQTKVKAQRSDNEEQDSFEILVESPQLKEYNKGEFVNKPIKMSHRSKSPSPTKEETPCQEYLVPQNNASLFFDLQNSLQTLKCTKEVLLVDDNPFNLMTASFIMQKLGFSVSKAFNGLECLSLLEDGLKQNKKYSLILTDIQMPVLDGLELSKSVTRKIRFGELYQVPIVAITANKLGPKEMKKYKECGIAYSVEKPLSLDAIKDILSELGLEPEN